MKIENVEIKNFGILHDVGLDLTDDNSTFVFLNGSNGNGKTTFLDALKWCFYNENPPTTKFLSNFTLRDLAPSETASASVAVEMLLDSAGTRATIRRTQLFEKSPDGAARRIGQPELEIKTRQSTSGAYTDILANPDLWLQQYFPKRLINFFLFNGELMDKFFGLNIRGSVEDAVRQIAGVDRFESIANMMDKIEISLNRKISRVAGKKSEAINLDLETHNSLLKQIYEKLHDAKQELRTARERKEEIVLILAEQKEIEEAAQELHGLDAIILRLDSEHQTAHEDFQSEILKNGTTSLLSSSFAELDKQVDAAKREDRLPPAFDPDRIQKLLDDQVCICGAHLESDEDKRRKLQELIEKHQVSSHIGKLLDETSREVQLIQRGLTEGWNVIKTKNSLVSRLRKELSDARAKRDKLLDIVGSHDVEEIRALAKERKSLDYEIDDFNRNIGQLQTQGDVVSNKIGQLQTDLAKASAGNTEAAGLMRQVDLAREIAKAANGIHSMAITSVRERLQASFSEKFAAVKRGKFVTKITDDFEVKIYNEYGQETELSEGEKNMKAYAFSMALRDVINLGFPLVVDTPFGRLDGYNRQEFAKVLSAFLAKEVSGMGTQAIFLMHDLEYTPYTRNYFSELGPVEVHLGEEIPNLKSRLGAGIDPEWLTREAWQDWAAGKIS